MPRHLLSRAEKRMFATCCFALLALGVGAVFVRARDAEPDWNSLLKAPAPLPKPNGFDYFLATAKAMIAFTPPVDPTSDPKIRVGADAAKTYSLARREKWLQTNARAWALWRRGLQTPSRVPPSDPRGLGFGNWATLRELARSNVARVNTLKMQNRPFDATIAALEGVQMGQDTSRGGPLIASLVGMAIQAISRSPLEDWNQTINKLSATQARIAAQRAEKILENTLPFSEIIEEERRMTLRNWKWIFSQPDWRTSDKFTERLANQMTSRRAIAEQIDRNFAEAQQQIARPYSQLQKTKIADPPAGTGIRASIPNSAINARAILNHHRNQLSAQMLMLRLALRSYIAQNGRAPQKLSELTPRILKTIPTDVYNDGKPFFYQPNGAKYKLWSVGPDGVNNGGIPLQRRPGDNGKRPVSNLLDNKGDFVAGLCR